MVVCSVLCRGQQQWLELVSHRVSACPSWVCTSSAVMGLFRWVLLSGNVPGELVGMCQESLPCSALQAVAGEEPSGCGRTAAPLERGGFQNEGKGLWHVSCWAAMSFVVTSVFFRRLLHLGSLWMLPPGLVFIVSPCPWWSAFLRRWDTTSWRKQWTSLVSIRRGSFRYVTYFLWWLAWLLCCSSSGNVSETVEALKRHRSCLRKIYSRNN